MSTLIEVRNSNGIVGRCDGKCYNAKEPKCVCVCGGKNHGAGLKQAKENTRKMTEQALEKATKDFKVTINRSELAQGELF